LCEELSYDATVARPPTETERFIEGFALALARSGMQRMAARVFAALLASERGSQTAKELGATLGVSPAAISGALSYLTRTGLVQRGREPGERVDHYGLGDEFWYETMIRRTGVLEDYVTWLDRGVRAAPRGSVAHARLQETLDFFDYIRTELPALLERWRATRGQG
jgi:DNA-binding transcriptional regulator GbsR (MarR family)